MRPDPIEYDPREQLGDAIDLADRECNREPRRRQPMAGPATMPAGQLPPSGVVLDRVDQLRNARAACNRQAAALERRYADEATANAHED